MLRKAVPVREPANLRAIANLGCANQIVDAIVSHRFQLLPTTGEHAGHAAELPRHLANPFDGVLAYSPRPISNAWFAARGAKIRAYGVPTLALAAICVG